MKLKIKFGEAIRYAIPLRYQIQTWAQVMSGNWTSLVTLAKAERPKPRRRHVD